MPRKTKKPNKCITCKKHIRHNSKTGYCSACYKRYISRTQTCNAKNCHKYIKKGEELYRNEKLLCKKCFEEKDIMSTKYLKQQCSQCGKKIPKDSEFYYKTKRQCSNKCHWRAKQKIEKEWNNRIYQTTKSKNLK